MVSCLCFIKFEIGVFCSSFDEFDCEDLELEIIG